MDALAASVRAAVAWLAREGGRYGIDPGRIYLAGHSAGGHLVALLAGADWREEGLAADAVKGGLAISGLYDLEPIRLSYLNAALHLDAAAARRLSPLHRVPGRAAPLVLAVGGDESAEYHRQQADLAAAWRRAGLAVSEVPLPGRNHFSALDALGEPGGPLFRALVARIRGGRA